MRELGPEQLAEAGIPDHVRRSPGFVPMGTSLPGVTDFAAEFFGYTAGEAESIDPQQRIFLEASWEALESAGHPPGKGGLVTGVFASSYAGHYSAAVFTDKARRQGLRAAIEDLTLTIGGQADFMTSRTAYKLGLRGPAVTIQTGCSASLYAVHYATLSLLAGECDIALAGGATVVEPFVGYLHQPGGVLSEDGYCRSYDASSTGTVYSSGVGVVVLRRLEDALADDDNVLAVLRGSAVGNDGGDRLGFVAPSPVGVADVISAALRVSGVPADQFCYVEGHGTGTAVGDTIELLALTDAFHAQTSRGGYCGLGSAMTNIGHTGPAAGITGFIKAVNVVRTGTIPPHPMFSRPRDPDVLGDSPFYVPTELRQCADPDRHVLVNSMGVGGTNVAAVLGAPPVPATRSGPTGSPVRLILSARTRLELDESSRRLAEMLDRREASVADVAHTLKVGRAVFTERRVVTAPADRIAAVLRMPRPPAAHTRRAESCDAVIALTGDAVSEPPRELLSALPAGTPVVRGLPDVQAEGTFVIKVRPTDLSNGNRADQIEDMLAEAWLHGVDVNWAALADNRGRRIPMTTYPFSRKRYWALDRMSTSPDTTLFAPAATASTGNKLETELTALWQELFGADDIGLDDQFGALGGTSLLSVQVALEIQQRYGVLINTHRAGGSKATIRRLARIVADLVEGASSAAEETLADGDGALVDRDLQLPLGEVASEPTSGSDVLLTGATGYLGSFLLRDLIKATTGRIYCVVRADSEAEGLERLKASAEKFALPEPDPERVRVVPGDLRDIGDVCRGYHNGELGVRVGHILHCAAKVVFTEPYQALREDNVLPLVSLLAWARAQGIRDFSFISTLAAAAPPDGSAGMLLETREQPLNPQLGGYGVGKWVAERLLERAEEDGMRVRVFRPGLILASTETGACNDKDLIWFVLASGLAVGAHPEDDQAMPVSPVNVLARAVVDLATSAASSGRAFHLVDEKSLSLRRMFELLAEVGLPTRSMPLPEWQRLVADTALANGNPVMSATALWELEDAFELHEDSVQARGWRSWLRKAGVSPAISGELLRDGLAYLASRRQEIGDLVPHLTGNLEEVAAP